MHSGALCAADNVAAGGIQCPAKGGGQGLPLWSPVTIHPLVAGTEFGTSAILYESQQDAHDVPNPWFRCYSEFADDPKVQMMTEQMQRRLIMLFCNRCKEETLHETQRAFHWRISASELAETKAVFVENGFIDDRWNLLNWNRRQFVSDSSTDRVRKYREGLKQGETLHETHVTNETVTVTPPDTDTEQKHKKSSRVKKPREVPTKTDIAKSRHADFKAAVGKYWESKNADVQMPWGPAEGRNLEMWLRESPQVTIEQFKAFLRNRYKSEVNHSERPSRWISNVTSYANGPLDRHRQPLTGGTNGNQQGKNVYISPAQQRRENSNAAITRAFDALRGGKPRGDDAAGESSETESRHHGRHGSGVHGGMESSGEEVRLDDVPGRVIDGVA